MFKMKKKKKIAEQVLFHTLNDENSRVLETFQDTKFQKPGSKCERQLSFVHLAVLPCPSGLNDGIQYIQLALNFYLLVQADPKLNVHNMQIRYVVNLCCKCKVGLAFSRIPWLSAQNEHC